MRSFIQLTLPFLMLLFLACEKVPPVILAAGETEQFSYELSTEASLLKTGRSIPLTLTITSKNPKLFTESELLGNSEYDILEGGELKSTSSKENTVFIMVSDIVYLEPGEYNLPSYLITGDEGPVVLSPEGSINIETSLMEEKEDFADIDPPVSLPGPGTLGWILITGIPFALAVLLFIFYTLFKRIRRKRNVPLDSYCLKELEKLKKTLPFPEGNKKRALLKNFYFKLTEIIRYFYDGIFMANTLEQTLEEYLPRVTINPAISQQDKQYLIKMLNMADKIKFASYEPEEEIPQAHLEFCRNFIKTQAYRLQEQKEKKA